MAASATKVAASPAVPGGATAAAFAEAKTCLSIGATGAVNRSILRRGFVGSEKRLTASTAEPLIVSTVPGRAATFALAGALASLPVGATGTVGSDSVGAALAVSKFRLAASTTMSGAVATPTTGAAAGAEGSIGAGVLAGSAA